MAQQLISRHKNSKGFSYTMDGSTVRDEKVIGRIKSLRVPPAWRNVHIAKSGRARILATGTDDAGRTQYIYNPAFRARQEQAKFDRILRFARALPHLRMTVDRDLRRRRLDYRKVMATIVAIMDRTYIRVGNSQYARANSSYGLTTLRSKHTEVKGNTITFDFRGKSGQHQVKKVTDGRLSRIVRQLDDLPGYEVFEYYDGAGELKKVKSDDVNSYIKEVMGEEFSAKDFRTWAGTLLAASELALATRPDNERERKKAVTVCVRKVARKLGNTPAIARASYIDPRIIETYMGGGDLRKVRASVETMKAKKGEQYLSPDERCVLAILEQPVPKS